VPGWYRRDRLGERGRARAKTPGRPIAKLIRSSRCNGDEPLCPSASRSMSPLRIVLDGLRGENSVARVW
jgi:hypothetical protein